MAENGRALRHRQTVDYNAKNFPSTPAWLKKPSSQRDDAHSPELGEPSVALLSGHNPLGPLQPSAKANRHPAGHGTSKPPANQKPPSAEGAAGERNAPPQPRNRAGAAQQQEEGAAAVPKGKQARVSMPAAGNAKAQAAANKRRAQSMGTALQPSTKAAAAAAAAADLDDDSEGSWGMEEPEQLPCSSSQQQQQQQKGKAAASAAAPAAKNAKGSGKAGANQSQGDAGMEPKAANKSGNMTAAAAAGPTQGRKSEAAGLAKPSTAAGVPEAKGRKSAPAALHARTRLQQEVEEAAAEPAPQAAAGSRGAKAASAAAAAAPSKGASGASNSSSQGSKAKAASSAAAAAAAAVVVEAAADKDATKRGQKRKAAEDAAAAATAAAAAAGRGGSGDAGRKPGKRTKQQQQLQEAEEELEEEPMLPGSAAAGAGAAAATATAGGGPCAATGVQLPVASAAGGHEFARLQVMYSKLLSTYEALKAQKIQELEGMEEEQARLLRQLEQTSEEAVIAAKAEAEHARQLAQAAKADELQQRLHQLQAQVLALEEEVLVAQVATEGQRASNLELQRQLALDAVRRESMVAVEVQATAEQVDVGLDPIHPQEVAAILAAAAAAAAAATEAAAALPSPGIGCQFPSPGLRSAAAAASSEGGAAGASEEGGAGSVARVAVERLGVAVQTSASGVEILVPPEEGAHPEWEAAVSSAAAALAAGALESEGREDPQQLPEAGRLPRGTPGGANAHLWPAFTTSAGAAAAGGEGAVSALEVRPRPVNTPGGWNASMWPAVTNSSDAAAAPAGSDRLRQQLLYTPKVAAAGGAGAVPRSSSSPVKGLVNTVGPSTGVNQVVARGRQQAVAAGSSAALEFVFASEPSLFGGAQPTAAEAAATAAAAAGAGAGDVFAGFQGAAAPPVTQGATLVPASPAGVGLMSPGRATQLASLREQLQQTRVLAAAAAAAAAAGQGAARGSGSSYGSMAETCGASPAQQLLPLPPATAAGGDAAGRLPRSGLKRRSMAGGSYPFFHGAGGRGGAVWEGPASPPALGLLAPTNTPANTPLDGAVRGGGAAAGERAAVLPLTMMGSEESQALQQQQQQLGAPSPGRLVAAAAEKLAAVQTAAATAAVPMQVDGPHATGAGTPAGAAAAAGAGYGPAKSPLAGMQTPAVVAAGGSVGGGSWLRQRGLGSAARTPATPGAMLPIAFLCGLEAKVLGNQQIQYRHRHTGFKFQLGPALSVVTPSRAAAATPAARQSRRRRAIAAAAAAGVDGSQDSCARHAGGAEAAADAEGRDAVEAAVEGQAAAAAAALEDAADMEGDGEGAESEEEEEEEEEQMAFEPLEEGSAAGALPDFLKEPMTFPVHMKDQFVKILFEALARAPKAAKAAAKAAAAE